ncbi:HAD family phosphatase [Nocardiopsis sp. YSL2]|uniref:HAD family hydrolase n=1 Tax=Nocardiopsis sp. YSL2 TaxID=2939492 RepID=UPI0026F44E66|nr:HAD family phosphatase [Nocardiopsis sp. YSL2]
MDAVLFDMFGVIARDQSEKGRSALVRAAGAPAEDFWSAYWHPRHAYDRGDLDGPGFWRAVGERLGTAFDDAAVAELVALDVRSWSHVDEDMVSFVGSLASDGVKLGLLSNIPHENAEYFERHHARVLDLFEVLGLSCRLNLAKPEAAAYQWCLEGLGVAPEKVLFVDDRPHNVDAAVALGLQGHVFTSRAALQERLGLR